MKKMRLYHSQQVMVYEIWKKMKLTIILLCISVFSSLAVDSYSQSTKLTLNLQNVTIKNVLLEIEENSEFRFFYSNNVDVERKVSINLRDKKVFDVLNKLFTEKEVRYKVIGRQIAIYGTQDKIESGFNLMQQKSVSGKVSDGSGLPLPGVTVIVKGTTQGTVTDANGNYILTNIPAKATLVFSFVGMRSQEVAVLGKQEVNVVLEEETIGLEEVVAIGYGLQTKTKITSSISELNTADLKNLPKPTSGLLLQGRMAGVTVNEYDGAPGKSPSVQIRGISSINAGIGALVVVDGSPVGTGIPTSLNPNDIEKVTVLKDAASTSIYGARGSNGVILIQTIKAKESQSEVEYNVYRGFQYVPQNWRPKTLNALQYAQYNKERVEEINAVKNTMGSVPQIFLDVLNNPQKYGKGTNWLDAIIRQGANAPFDNHNLTFRAGNKQFRGVVSGGYLNQEGILPNTNFKRYSIRTNIDGNFTKWLKAGANVSIVRTESNTIPIIGMFGTMMSAIVASPLQSPYDENGNIIPFLPADAPGYFSNANPIYKAKVVKNNTIGRDNNASMNIDIQIIKGLHYKTQVYARLFTEAGSTFVPTTVGGHAVGTTSNLSLGAPPYINTATNSNRDITNWGIDNLLTYDKEMGNHSFNVLLGYTAQKQTGELSQINAKDFPTDYNLNYLEASEVSASISDYTNWSLAAAFCRIQYDYKRKYLAELNIRREGSSRFATNNKYGNFPSGSIGWRVSQEDFYPKDFFINELKIRSSYGITGNSAIGDFDRFGTIISIPDLDDLDDNYNYVLNDKVVIGKSLSSLGSQNLQWETARQLDIGLTLGFLQNHITLKVDYYKKITENMLFNVSLPLASGFGSVRNNIGEMLNQGWDFEVRSNFNAKDFTWNSNLNVSLLRNKVTFIPDQIEKIISRYNVTQEGSPVGSLYGFILEGIFNTQEQLDDPKLFGWRGAKKLGAFIYKDVNGDGKISGSDKSIIGNPHPQVVVGFNNTFTYRNLSLSILTTGAFGYQILNRINQWLYNEKGRWNVSTKFLNRWRSPDDPGEGVIPAIYYPGQHPTSNALIENGDHLWIKNITLSYKIPPSLLNRTKFISNLRFHLGIQNAFLFTKYSGWNPQVSTYGASNPQVFGVDNFSYPITRTYTLGATINL